MTPNTPLNVSTITIDCADALVVARFWSAALGAPVGADGSASFASIGLDNGPTLSFVAVPEPKSVKNRVHLDLATDDLAREVARLRALGAVEVHAYDDAGGRWTTLRDVEGNEFCVVG